MPIVADTLLEEARCLGCNSEASEASLLKLGLWKRMVTGVEEAVASFVARSGITSAAQIAAVTTLVANAMAHGWWSKCDLIYPFVGGTAGAHAQNLKSSNFTITWNGTVTHNANGVTGDGATGYGATGYIPSSSGQITLNSVHAGIYRRTSGGFTTYIGGGDAAAIVQVAATFGGVTRTIVGMNELSAIPGINTSLGFVAGARLDGANKHYYSSLGDSTSATASTSIATVPLIILGMNNNGTPGSFQTANLAGATAGSGITLAEYELMKADWQTFQTSLGRQA